VTRKVIETAGQLKVIVRQRVGVYNIDLEAAPQHGVQVVYTPDGLTISVAEFTVSAILAVLKRIKQRYTAVRNGNWNARYLELLGRELFGKIVGIVGLARIGMEVVRSFGCFRKGTTAIEQPSVEVTERFALTAHAAHTREALSRTAIDVAEAVKTVLSRTALGKSGSSTDVCVDRLTYFFLVLLRGRMI
jgi:hypothetical protein